MTDIRKLDPQTLLVFESLLETQSASVSAARLGLSQSAVSGALRRLRDLFGDPLFKRHSRGLTPTKRAAALSIQLAETLNAMRDLASVSEFDPGAASGTVVFLATDYAAARLIAPFSADMAKTAPGLQIVIRPYTDEQATLTSQIVSTDFLVGSPPMLPDMLRSRHLLTDQLALFMDAGHPLVGRDITLADLAQYPHAMISLRGRTGHAKIDDLLAEQGLSRHVDVICPSFLSLPLFLKDSARLALAPAGLQPLFAGTLIARTVPFDLPKIEVYAAWHRRFADDKRHAWLRQALDRSSAGAHRGAGQTVK